MTMRNKVAEGNVFTPVCQNVFTGSRGVYLNAFVDTHPLAGTPPLGRYTPWQVQPPAVTPPADAPHGQVHPLDRYTPWQVPSWAGTPSSPGRYPPPQRSLLRMVRILLECCLFVIFVSIPFS